MSLANIGAGANNNYLRVAQNESKAFRLLLIPGDPKFGDIKEAWFHQLSENPIPGSGKDRGKFRGYERCLNSSRNDTTCPFCKDRKRFPASMRRAVNIWSYSDNKVMVLFQGPQVWEGISTSLDAHARSLNAQNEAQGKSERYDVYTVSAIIDFTISRNSNNQYQVMPIMNATPVNFDRSQLIDLDTLDDFQLSTPERLNELKAELLAVPVQYSGMPLPVVTGTLTTGLQGMAQSNPGVGGIIPPPVLNVGGSAVPPPAFNPVPQPPVMTNVAPQPPVPSAIPQMPQMNMSSSPSLSLDDAKSITCTMGKYQGKTLGFIADNDPGYLLGYMRSGSANIPDGIVKTAIGLIAEHLDNAQSDTNLVEFNSVGGASVDEIKEKINSALMSGTISFDSFTTAILKCGNGKTGFEFFTQDEVNAVAVELGI